MQTAMCNRLAVPAQLQRPSSLSGLRPRLAASPRPLAIAPRAAQDGPPKTVVLPVNGDPYIGMLETPVTSAPIVAGYLSNLPAYRTGVSPLLRGVEIGLAHGLLATGPFIKLGPLRNVDGVAEIAGSLSAAGLVLILTACLTIYGAAKFQQDKSEIGVKTLSGRPVDRDPLQSSEGWQKFTGGWLVGGLSGVAWGYILTQILPYYY
jgi:photosystem I subunit 11